MAAKMDQAAVAASLMNLGVGGAAPKADSQWNYLTVDPWRTPWNNQPTKKALWEQTQTPTIATNGTGMSATHEFIAMPTGAGKKGIIIPWSDYDVAKPNICHITSASMKLEDLQFSPHRPSILCGSSSVSSSLRIWDISTYDSGVKNIDHSKTFLGHDGTAIQQFAWNPVVPGIIATSAKDIRIHDIEFETKFQKSPVYSGAEAVQGPITSISWAMSGNIISLCSKANISLLDIRDKPSKTKPFVVDGYTNKAKVQCVMIGNKVGPISDTYVVTSGSDSLFGSDGRIQGLKRVLKLWDCRVPGKSVQSLDLSNTNVAADLHYEPSTGLLFVVDKNSHGLYPYDLTRNTIQPLGSLRKNTQHQYYTILDRKYADTSSGEFSRFVYLDRQDKSLGVERIFKETGQNQKGLIPGSLPYIPSLYPDCVGCRTSRTSKEWEDSNFDSISMSLCSMAPNQNGPDCLQLNVAKGTLVTATKWDENGKLIATNEKSGQETARHLEKDHNKLLDHLDRETERVQLAASNLDVLKLNITNDTMETILGVSPDGDTLRVVLDEIAVMNYNLEKTRKLHEKDNAKILKKMESLGQRRFSPPSSLMRHPSSLPTTPLNHPIFDNPEAFVRSIIMENELSRQRIDHAFMSPVVHQRMNNSRDLDEIHRLRDEITRLKAKNKDLKSQNAKLQGKYTKAKEVKKGDATPPVGSNECVTCLFNRMHRTNDEASELGKGEAEMLQTFVSGLHRNLTHGRK